MKIKNLAAALKWSTLGILPTGILADVLLWTGAKFLVCDMTLIDMLFCVGIITTLAVTLALGAIAKNHGAASALLRSFPFLLGGTVAPLTGTDNIILSMDALIILCVTICFVLWCCSLRMNRA